MCARNSWGTRTRTYFKIASVQIGTGRMYCKQWVILVDCAETLNVSVYIILSGLNMIIYSTVVSTTNMFIIQFTKNNVRFIWNQRFSYLVSNVLLKPKYNIVIFSIKCINMTLCTKKVFEEKCSISTSVQMVFSKNTLQT